MFDAMTQTHRLPASEAPDARTLTLRPATTAMDAFHEQLRTTGAYTTPDPLPPPCGKMLARWRFHLGMQRIIFRGSWLARQGKFDRRAWAGQGFSAQQLVERLGGRIHYRGFAPAAAVSGPVVWVANHMSMLETFTLFSALLAFGDVSVVLKRSLMRYPVFGRSVSATDPIAVTRSNPRADLKQVLKEGGSCLSRGRSVLMFPQSTRTRTLDSRQFNSLGVKLAQRANVPVVPVALATDFASPGRWLRDFGPVDPAIPVRFSAAPPIGPGLPPRQWQQCVFEALAESLTAWGYPVRQEEPT